MPHSWKIIGVAFLIVAYLISAYQLFRAISRPRQSENFRWFLPRALVCLLLFFLFIHWLVKDEWQKYKELRSRQSVHGVISPR
jgi:hypothetical protein